MTSEAFLAADTHDRDCSPPGYRRPPTAIRPGAGTPARSEAVIGDGSGGVLETLSPLAAILTEGAEPGRTIPDPHRFRTATPHPHRGAGR